jgi:hypothetical protein
MKTLLAALLLIPALAWADLAKHAEYAAEQVLIEENVLTVYFTANDEGRLTILFGSQVPDWQVEAVLARLNAEPAIRGITHSKVDTQFCPIR